MSMRVKVDRRGRIVIPLHERERLGVATGGFLELLPTPDGLLLQRRHRAEVRMASDGLPVIIIHDLERATNEASLEAIHRDRARG